MTLKGLIAFTLGVAVVFSIGLLLGIPMPTFAQTALVVISYVSGQASEAWVEGRLTK